MCAEIVKPKLTGRDADFITYSSTIYFWLSYKLMEKLWGNIIPIVSKKKGWTKKVFKEIKIKGKYDILTVQEKERAHRGNKTNGILEMSPYQRER